MKDRTSSSYESMCLSDVLYRKCVCLFVIIKIVQQIENELMSAKLQILSKDFFQMEGHSKFRSAMSLCDSVLIYDYIFDFKSICDIR